MILEDFVMLGTTVPEPNSDGRVFVCSAGISPQLRRLVRIYPLARHHAPHRWGIYRVPVELNPQDSRIESFKIAGDRTPDEHYRINNQFQEIGTTPDADRPRLLAKYTVESIQQANQQRLSLAIIHPAAMDVYFEHNSESPDSPQLRLFDYASDKPVYGAKRFSIIPRLQFEDAGGTHRLMIRDWGVYELLRKRGPEYFQANLSGALHLRADSSLLVGNMNNRRNTWLIISVLNGIRSHPTLFDSLQSSRTAIPTKDRQAVYERGRRAHGRGQPGPHPIQRAHVPPAVGRVPGWHLPGADGACAGTGNLGR